MKPAILTNAFAAVPLWTGQTRTSFSLSFLLAIVVLASCACLNLYIPKPVTIPDAPALVEYLDSKGLSYIYDGPMSSPHMSVPGHAFTMLSGGELHVFEYSSGTGALLDVTWLDDWVGDTPGYYMYRSDRMTVLYYGNDPRTMRALHGAFGSPVHLGPAGRYE